MRRTAHRTLTILLMVVVPAGASEPVSSGPRPRLLVRGPDLPAIRAACGLSAAPDAPAQIGWLRADFQRLREAAQAILRERARADDLFAPAVVHLIVGRPQSSDEWTRYITSELLEPSRTRYELDAIIALDYCWEAIQPAERLRIADRILPTLQPLDNRQSPFAHFDFYPRLCSLAAAIVLDDPELLRARPELATRLRGILTMARGYFSDPFIAFCRQRGVMPTSGENGVTEEADFVLAVELWLSAGGDNLWPQLKDSLGRVMEHYFYADTGHPALAHGFVHDDGSLLPLQPGQAGAGFVPAVPSVLAARTEDPVAIGYAARLLNPSAPPDPLEDRHRWSRILYPVAPGREPNRLSCPLARNFGGGWIAMRSGWSGGDTLVLFDAGQPFWRSRQHFDAGQFQIHRKGRLAIDSGDDVAHDATGARGGRALIGGQPGDWDDYAQATIAHNCVTVADPAQEMRIYGRVWRAMGNQRLIERDYVPAVGDVNTTVRRTGTLTAFETNRFYSYAAADLTPAYPPKIVTSLHRQILLLSAGAVVVMDHVLAEKPLTLKTWHLQLPVRPVAGAGGQARAEDQGAAGAAMPLEGAHQLHGVGADAGIWELEPQTAWLEVPHQDGKLFVRSLLPVGARRRVMGGPMRPRQLTGGPLDGVTYYGGDAQGYEHRLWPASILRGPNAAYELGRPTGLGPHFGVGSTWGRFEVSPSSDARSVTFLHVLIPADRTQKNPAEVSCELDDSTAHVRISLPDQLAELRLSLERPAGRITLRGAGQAPLIDQDLASSVQENAPIPLSVAK